MSEEMDCLGERIAEQAAHLDAAMHRLLTDLRQFDQGGGWHTQGALSCARWLSWRVGWELATAREHVRVANKLAELPAIDGALSRGELSYSKVRAMTRVATLANEQALLELARFSTAQQLETICRKYAMVQRHERGVGPKDDVERRHVTRRDTADGMVRIEAVLHPEEAALVWAALDHVAKRACQRPPRVSAETSGGAERDSGDGAENGARRDSLCVSAEASGGAERDSGDGAENGARRDSLCVSAETSGSKEPDSGGRVENQAWRESPCVSAETSRSAEPDPGDGANQACRGSRRVSAETLRTTDHAPAQLLSRQSRFDRADALVAIAQAYVRGGRPDRSPIEVTIAVEATTLAHAGGDDPSAVAVFADGACVSAETARRLCCDAGLIEITQERDGRPVSVGRKRRTISGSMKRALLRRDRTCRYPGCSNRVFLEAHHIQHWADGGQTEIDNMISMCTRHHRYVHEYGYSIELTDRGPSFRDQHGRPVEEVPAALRPQGLGWPAIRAHNHPLGITALTNECHWDGHPVDYVEVIDQLIRADEPALVGWAARPRFQGEDGMRGEPDMPCGR